MKNIRESWVSRLAFIMAAAGSAVGLGNIWRFPYIVGTNGGAAFVVIYVVIIFVIGYPIMTTEITLGQKAQKNPIGTFKALAPNTPWWLVGALGVLAGVVILSFYSVVAGWAMAYFFKTLSGEFTSQSDTLNIFLGHIGSATPPLLWHAVFMALTAGVVGLGIVKGIGQAVKYLMPALFVLVVLLMLRALTLDGALEGVSFYLRPDFSQIRAQTFLDGIGQAFFSLSLGMGAIITYGSYMRKDDDVPASAAWVIGLDTGIALLAGLAIFPAVFALGFDPEVGAGLAFITLPAVFAAMPLGNLFGALFFLLLTIAALTSAFSLLEVVVAWLIDEKGIHRLKATLITASIIFLLGVPASLSMGAVELNLFGIPFFDVLDQLQEKFLLPIGALLTSLFAGYVYKAHHVRTLANEHAHTLKLGAWFEVLIRYIVPLAIVVILITGIYATYFA